MIVYHKKSKEFRDLPEKEAFQLILDGTHVNVAKDSMLAYLYVVVGQIQRQNRQT